VTGLPHLGVEIFYFLLAVILQANHSMSLTLYKFVADAAFVQIPVVAAVTLAEAFMILTLYFLFPWRVNKCQLPSQASNPG
jgi:hypothetical protein